MTAYLVIREGSKWTDVFRLVDGESVTIGRAPTNAIVVKDEEQQDRQPFAGRDGRTTPAARDEPGVKTGARRR